MKAIYLRWLVAIGSALGVMAPAAAEFAMPPLTIHGALAQAYVRSTGNNYFGSSTGSGSRDFYEVAINGNMSLHPKLLLTGQLMSRQAGSVDDSRIRVDYFQMDYQILTEPSGSFGIRLGKLKNPYGLYNASRDVVFSRPGITMPASVYFTGLGLRDLLFSTEAAHIYGSWQWGQTVSELVLGAAPKFDATSIFVRAFGSAGLEGTRIKARDFYVGQWAQDWGLGRFRTALSYLGARLAVESSDPDAFIPVTGLDADVWVASMQWQNPYSSFTAEYVLASTCSKTVQGDVCGDLDGIYAQYRRILNTDLAGYLRYDLRWLDRNDRSGREYEEETGMPRETRYSRDHVLGLDWKFSPGWGLFGEYHYIVGAAQANPVENQGRELDDRSQMVLIMLGYRF